MLLACLFIFVDVTDEVSAVEKISCLVPLSARVHSRQPPSPRTCTEDSRVVRIVRDEFKLMEYIRHTG